MKLLSLCIPTYNRVTFLEESLTAIVQSIPVNQQANIELVISDNASSDETPALLVRFQQQYSQLSWVVIRQDSNIGPSNVTVVTKYAMGEFIWILSDDDIVTASAIPNILKILHKTPSLNSIIVNYAPFKDDLRFLKEAILPKIAVLQTANDFLIFLNSNITFISIMVFRRSLTALPLGARGLSSLCQCYMFLDVLIQNKTAYLPDIGLAVRGNNSGGYNFYKVFIAEFEQILEYAKTLGFTETAVAQTRVKHFPFLLRFSIALRLNTTEQNVARDWSQEVKLIWSCYPYRFIPILTICVLQIPDLLVKLALPIMNRLRGKHAA